MTLCYDKVFEKEVEDDYIDYGVVYGNEKIVFIKTGAGGDIDGYQEKYRKMAHRIHERLGVTVICSSNPDTEYASQFDADRAMIEKVAVERSFLDYEVMLFGTSDGAYQNLLFAQQCPQVTRFLGVNPSMISYDAFAALLQEIPQVKKLLVYGTKDEFYEYVPLLKALDCIDLEIMTVEGADHTFHGMLAEYMALMDLL